MYGLLTFCHPAILHCKGLKITQIAEGMDKQATKNIQLVLHHCCKTSCISSLSCTKSSCWQVWRWVVKCAKSLWNSFAVMVQNKLHVFCRLFFRTFQYSQSLQHQPQNRPFFTDCFSLKFAAKTPTKLLRNRLIFREFVPKNPVKFDFFFGDLSEALKYGKNRQQKTCNLFCSGDSEDRGKPVLEFLCGWRECLMVRMIWEVIWQYYYY